MKKKDIFQKNYEELKTELFDLLRESFNLRMQSVSNKTRNTHLLKQVRRNIARVKTLLTNNNK